MALLDSFNNLNPFINFLIRNNITLQIIHFLSVFLVNAISYLYIFIKFYKVLCYSKMTFEWLPIINPYIWPFSLFQVLTVPYFSFWAKIFPSIKFENSSLEISGIIALEALNSLLFFCVRSTHSLITILEETEKLLETPI